MTKLAIFYIILFFYVVFPSPLRPTPSLAFAYMMPIWAYFLLISPKTPLRWCPFEVSFDWFLSKLCLADAHLSLNFIDARFDLA